jgi:hypothetical protein
MVQSPVWEFCPIRDTFIVRFKMIFSTRTLAISEAPR